MLWSRKPSQATVHDRSRVVGIDLTTSRARAVSAGGGQARPLLLDDPSEELLLHIAADRRTPEVGRAGYALCRKLPHAVCSNFLPFLARDREWRTTRHTLTADEALALAFERLAPVITAESEAAALALPAYLEPGQVSRAVAIGMRTKLPLKGTATAPLALAATRAAAVLGARDPVAALPRDWVVPLRPTAGGAGAVVVVDTDDHALSVAVVAVDREQARLLRFWHSPRLSSRAWKDRLLDAVSDRCVRLCRRDPRDAADAEQALFEQLDDAMDRVRAGQRVSLTVRTASWYQDVVQQPDEVSGYCHALTRAATDGVREVVGGAGLAAPPRSIWLTDAAARLPGLALAIHQNAHEGTAVELLPPGATAHAAAALIPRWLTGELPRAHLDAAIPIPPTPGNSRMPGNNPGTARGRG